VVNIVNGSGVEAGKPLASSPMVAKVAFTGETTTGRLMSKAQFEYWSFTHLTIDVVPGRGGGFSLEAPLGVRFLIRSRLLTEEELSELKALGS
jgi:uncharacterized protein (DUF779 family)